MTDGCAGHALPLPDPPLVDGDLSLRPWHEADAPVLVAAWTDPEIARWTGVPEARDEAAARRWIAGDAARRQRGLALDLVILRAGLVVGEVGLAGFDAVAHEAEIGWWVAAGHRGQGLASRAAALLTEWALAELCVERLVARCHDDNPGSGAVARRAGFVGSPPDAAGVRVWRSATAPARGTVPA